MNISCVLNADEILADPPDLVVLPEGVDPAEFDRVLKVAPESIIVGAVTDGQMCRGVLWHHGQNQIEYLKVGSDGRTSVGSGNMNQMPVYQSGLVCIGVVICMDVGEGRFSRPVIDRVRSSAAEFKVVCVPGDMVNHWFASSLAGSEFTGVNVAVCNLNPQPPGRCKSFVADQYGTKISLQKSDEPLLTILGEFSSFPQAK